MSSLVERYHHLNLKCKHYNTIYDTEGKYSLPDSYTSSVLPPATNKIPVTTIKEGTVYLPTDPEIPSHEPVFLVTNSQSTTLVK